MARRTKQEAQETRTRLLNAAEQLFSQQGVAGTSLAHIATAAGTTRGAIYWHFKDKADLFNAMMDRQTLPFEETLEDMMQNRSPIQAMRDHAINIMSRIENDAQAHRVLTIALLMVEMVPEHQQIRERNQQSSVLHMQRITEAILVHSTQEGLNLSVQQAKEISLGFHSLIFGLMHQWLLGQNFNLAKACESRIDAYLHGSGLSLSLQK